MMMVITGGEESRKNWDWSSAEAATSTHCQLSNIDICHWL